MILKDELSKLLARQDIGNQMDWYTLEPEWREEYGKDADEIMAFFIDAIKKLEFTLSNPPRPHS